MLVYGSLRYVPLRLLLYVQLLYLQPLPSYACLRALSLERLKDALEGRTRGDRMSSPAGFVPPSPPRCFRAAAVSPAVAAAAAVAVAEQTHLAG